MMDLSQFNRRMTLRQPIDPQQIIDNFELMSQSERFEDSYDDESSASDTSGSGNKSRKLVTVLRFNDKKGVEKIQERLNKLEEVLIPKLQLEFKTLQETISADVSRIDLKLDSFKKEMNVFIQNS